MRLQMATDEVPPASTWDGSEASSGGQSNSPRHDTRASDFDETQNFNNSGDVLIGLWGCEIKFQAVAHARLAQQKKTTPTDNYTRTAA